MATGRTSEGRAVTATTTNASTAITGAAGTFNEEDAGAAITAASGLQAGTTIASVTSDTDAVLSLTANATGSRTVTIGSLSSTSTLSQGQRYGFIGWSPETDAESESYSNAAAGGGSVGPDRLTNAFTPVSQRGRG